MNRESAKIEAKYGRWVRRPDGTMVRVPLRPFTKAWARAQKAKTNR